MKTKILLTSFQTWLPHQKSNSSDDLLAKMQTLDYSSNISLFFLRNLPVVIKLASHKVIVEVERVKPDVILCCGMAEKRSQLTVESNAFSQNECLYTSIDLVKLTQELVVTKISDDAGKFVCEGLYYKILKHLQLEKNTAQCIFIHVPLLENINLKLVLKDLQQIFDFVACNSTK